MKNKEIQLGIGLGDIKFGYTMEEIEKMLGEPEEVEESDETDEFEHQAWNYWEDGYSFYFDKEDDYRLSCIETANPDVTLWGETIFDKEINQVKDLFKQHNIENPEIERLETGETRLSYEKEMIDIYYEGEKMIAVNFGVFINDDLEVVWPV
ncbi:MAG: hypothetical protein LPK19_03335 [Hymenobacteraceae bacterium]|nr:hypothetical protein [Hymenobacteraceae bacterium]MDX5395225.1 hypothetical protein [Hymenobacteraceae bacterium]MDX5511263.1 hypothetical protein [Hymenobacteraceae bacterium]